MFPAQARRPLLSHMSHKIIYFPFGKYIFLYGILLDKNSGPDRSFATAEEAAFNALIPFPTVAQTCYGKINLLTPT